jgi:hypothetical protein
VRAEADPPIRPEEVTHDVQERAFEVGKRDFLVDREAFELVEDRIAGRGDRVAAVDTPNGDHVDRGLLLLEHVDLRRRRLRAQDVLVVEEERVSM